ncbi:hypothetical protein [Bradyrhizobium sp. AUGA SZCCT0283]|uniref:hypothetical protein n=1 Tax=Bradyrhizobium sp. AUGA SZCCT0283 TaxID=2807671 RepID=UPI001BABF185|nr:hypothetical protein [Bradyrhizobium sp. AUGA SZCCT0283]MBR1279265.1 hypothetical protein [Bradyrhizobium sp. AUGA SZCCT0283]
MDNDKLNERLTYLEGQVHRLLVALCCALNVILDRRPYFFAQDWIDAFIRMMATVASSFVVGWPIVRWVVAKKAK